MYPWLTISPSTTLRRVSAASGYCTGSHRLGDWVIPASSAAWFASRSAAEIEK